MSYLKTKFASTAYGTFLILKNIKLKIYDIHVAELNISSYIRKLNTEYIYNVVVNWYYYNYYKGRIYAQGFYLLAHAAVSKQAWVNISYSLSFQSFMISIITTYIFDPSYTIFHITI